MPVSIAVGSTLTIGRSRHCFDHLVTAQAGMSLLFFGGQRPTPEQGINQICYVEPVELRWYPAPLFRALDQSGWPSSIDMTIEWSGPLTKNDPGDGIKRLWGSFYQQAFITYFETNRDDIEAKFGATKYWPETMTFGRILRNAFAHGGAIHIQDRATARWRGLTYSDAQNGRQVLYNDMTQGDLTVLMLDMDEFL